MRKPFLLSLCLSLLFFAKAQLVQFKATNYYVGDDVKVDVLSGGPITVENDLKKASELWGKGGTNLSLGTIARPGIYRVRFLFSNQLSETYFIVAGKKPDDITKASVQPSTKGFSNPAVVNDVLTKLGSRYKEISWNDIAKASLTEYAQTHVLSGTLTLVLCLSAGPAPALLPVCIGNAQSEAKELSCIVLKKTAGELAKKGIITNDQAKAFTGAVDALCNAVDFFSAKGKLDKLLTALSIAGDYALQNETLKLMVQQEKQLYDQTRILIQLGKD